MPMFDVVLVGLWTWMTEDITSEYLPIDNLTHQPDSIPQPD